MSEYSDDRVGAQTLTLHRWRKLSSATQAEILRRLDMQRDALIGLSIREVEDKLRALPDQEGERFGDHIADDVLQVGYSTTRFRASEAEYM